MAVMSSCPHKASSSASHWARPSWDSGSSSLSAILGRFGKSRRSSRVGLSGLHLAAKPSKDRKHLGVLVEIS